MDALGRTAQPGADVRGLYIEHYTVESIIRPWDYFVPTYPEFTMPNDYKSQLSYQDLADLIAYLSSQDQLE
jgi:hypothetical protein